MRGLANESVLSESPLLAAGAATCWRVAVGTSLLLKAKLSVLRYWLLACGYAVQDDRSIRGKLLRAWAPSR